MDWITVLTTHAQRFVAATSVEYVVAGLLQNLTRQSTDDFLVFHEQDGFRPTGCGSFDAWVFGLLFLAVEVRQINLHGGATLRLAINPNVAAALFHDPVNSGQPETGTAAFVFSRKERFKNSRFGVRAHSATG